MRNTIRVMGPVIALIGINLVTVAGVVFWQWRINEILILYWLESGIIGIFNVLKILFLPDKPGQSPGLVPLKYFLATFFVSHFGLFMAVHLGFIVFLTATLPYGLDLWQTCQELKWAIAGLFLSHGYSFVANYWVAGERNQLTAARLFVQPYRRIGPMQLALMVGAMAAGSQYNNWAILVVFVVVKIVVDLFSHRAEHAQTTISKTNKRDKRTSKAGLWVLIFAVGVILWASPINPILALWNWIRRLFF